MASVGGGWGVYRKFTYLGSPYLTLVRDEVYFAGKRIRSGGVAVAEDRLVGCTPLLGRP